MISTLGIHVTLEQRSLLHTQMHVLRSGSRVSHLVGEGSRLRFGQQQRDTPHALPLAQFVSRESEDRFIELELVWPNSTDTANHYLVVVFSRYCEVLSYAKGMQAAYELIKDLGPQQISLTVKDDENGHFFGNPDEYGLRSITLDRLRRHCAMLSKMRSFITDDGEAMNPIRLADAVGAAFQVEDYEFQEALHDSIKPERFLQTYRQLRSPGSRIVH